MIQILDLMEFQVLAAAKGLETYYGFAREERLGEPDEVYYAVYQLARSGILVKNGEQLEIQPPTSDYINCILKSPWLLVADSGGFSLPRQCFYRQKGLVAAVENSTTDRGKICLWGMDDEEFLQHLSDLNQLPKARIQEDIGYFDFGSYYREQVSPELFQVLEAGFEVGTARLLGSGPVHTAFSVRDKIDGRLHKRMVLLDLPMEYCMVLQEEQGTEYLQYTLKDAADTLEKWAADIKEVEK